ncbi:MAG: 30S ribosomal protein S12 methylthiotransferase RimO [Myxococcota bacterium]
MQRVHLVSLGCSKNRVDSEVMVGTLVEGGFELVDEPDGADVIVVNTCSFIQPATEESIDTVLEMSQYKTEGSAQKLVVTGCMVQRYGTSLEAELPEVDHFLGTGEYHRIADVLKSRDAQAPRSFVDTPLYIHDEFAPRVNSWSACSAYLKISEGCNHTCAFCIIPTLRGKLRSRTVDSLVAEAKTLASQGVRELNLVSQDSTAYGRDLKDGSDLGVLMRSLAKVEGIEWIRLHYAYPHGVPTSFLEAMAQEDKICKYIDIPLQHASGPMLKAMKRGVTRAGQERILDRLRQYVPDATLRTTFIVGFPGETEEDFQELCDFVRSQRFDHVGVFTYFPEDGTPAATLPNQVPDEVKQERQATIMGIQAEISRGRLQNLVGSEIDVLIEGLSEESELLLRGRAQSQAPDVDGQVYIASAPSGVRVGEIRRLRVTQAADYDLVGELVDVVDA